MAVWPQLPPVAAKTGTLKHTLALAGLLDADSAAVPPVEPVFFAIFLNPDLRDRAAQRREIAELLRQWRRSRPGTS